MKNFNKKQVIAVLENISQFSWAILLAISPVFFLTATTDFLILPKQIILAIVLFVNLICFGAQTIIERKVRLRQTFLDLPMLIFAIALLLSAMFSVQRPDALVAFVVYLLFIVSYFVIINTVKSKQTLMLLITSVVLSAVITAVLAVLSYLKIYILPFTFTHSQTFSPIGTTLDQTIFLAAILPISVFLAYPIIKGQINERTLGFGAASVLIIVGAALSAYQLITQKPVILPFSTGFQIAMAAISQDAPRTAQGFFFGSGVGTFITDFTRFKQAAFNSNANWFISFFSSSSLALELLATTGIIGLLSYIFIIGRTVTNIQKHILTNPVYVSILVIFVVSFIFPVSFTLATTLFILLAIFTTYEGEHDHKYAKSVEFVLVSLPSAKISKLMPIVFFTIILIFAGVIAYFATVYVMSDIAFEQSLEAAQKNNGLVTYQKQIQAINLFPYRDGLYRSFSQTNIALANSLLTINSKDDAQKQKNQQDALTLIQQSINSARTATNIGPLNVLNWQNLGSIYRSLIGFGQGADSFAIQTTQQSIILDPNNPQEYIVLGGIYYQLGQYDNAIKAFQAAVNLKPDFANAYYNLGHAYEQKGDLQSALTNYQAVSALVASNQQNKDKIDTEIAAVEQKLGKPAQQAPTQQTQQEQAANPSAGSPQQNSGQAGQGQQPLNIPQPSPKLPEQTTPVPLATNTPTPTPAK